MADFPFPYAEAQFDRDGAPVGAAQGDTVRTLVTDGAITDVLVMSHGWNNDMGDARALFSGLAASMRDRLAHHPPAAYGDRKLAFVGVLWPSKKFADSDLIPGGAAGLDADGTGELRAQLADLAGFLDRKPATAALDEAAGLVEKLDSHAGQQRFVELVRAALAGAPPDKDVDLDASATFMGDPGPELMKNLSQAVDVPGGPAPGGAGGAVDLDVDQVGGGGPAGGAAGFDLGLGGIVNGAKRLLNYATYYEMKARAGQVGASGVRTLLEDVAREAPGYTPPRIHLAGHSFGARVVSMAAKTTQPVVPISSMSLLQAAFSHYGFATHWENDEDGFFEPVLSQHRLVGPMIVTHTANDTAVGIAYALASMIADQVAAGLGGPDDKFGGLGRNGALSTKGAVDETLLAADGTYDLSSGQVHNLLADPFIHSHGDVRGREVALAVLSAIATTG